MGQHQAAPLASYSTCIKRSVETIFILMAIQSVDKSVWIFHSNENTKCTIQSVGKCTGNFSLMTIQSVEKSVGISFWWQVNDLAVMTPDMVDGHQTPDLDDLVDNLRRPHNLRWQKVVQCVRGLSWHIVPGTSHGNWRMRLGIKGGASAELTSDLSWNSRWCSAFSSPQPHLGPGRGITRTLVRCCRYDSYFYTTYYEEEENENPDRLPLCSCLVSTWSYLPSPIVLTVLPSSHRNATHKYFLSMYFSIYLSIYYAAARSQPDPIFTHCASILPLECHPQQVLPFRLGTEKVPW